MSFKKFLLNLIFFPWANCEAVLSFYIGKKSGLNNYHIIHNETCELLPEKEARIPLGSFENFNDVVSKGKRVYQEVKLCPYCCNFE